MAGKSSVAPKPPRHALHEGDLKDGGMVGFHLRRAHVCLALLDTVVAGGTEDWITPTNAQRLGADPDFRQDLGPLLIEAIARELVDAREVLGDYFGQVELKPQAVA